MKKIKWSYALGEILIVILGISIAFSMNKCANDNRDQKLKNQYIKSLISDLEADRSMLEGNIETMTKKIDTIAPLLRILNTNRPNKQRLLKNIFFASQTVEFRPKNETYKTLINSGDLKLIEGLQIKNGIQEHYGEGYGQLKSSYDRIVNINKKYLADYFIYNNLTEVKLVKGVNFQFENERLLKGIFRSIDGATKFKVHQAKQSIKSCDALIEKLKQELD